MPLTGPIPEGHSFFCSRCGALYAVTYSRRSKSVNFAFVSSCFWRPCRKLLSPFERTKFVTGRNPITYRVERIFALDSFRSKGVEDHHVDPETIGWLEQRRRTRDSARHTRLTAIFDLHLGREWRPAKW